MKTKHCISLLTVILLLIAISPGTAHSAVPVQKPPVVKSARHDTGPSLKSLSLRSHKRTTGPSHEIPMFKIPLERSPGSDLQSSLFSLQSQNFPWTMPETEQNFEGMPNVNNRYPPDTQGDVGPNHYVQIVNLSFAIWDKQGNPLFGPADNNTVWQDFGGPCEETNHGDPIVLYDHLSDRWLLSRFALPNGRYEGPFYQCIAISETPDPTEKWHRYEFKISDTKFNDYPKFGVWPDGYYMSVNQFENGRWAGGGAIAFERDKMLRGLDARMIYFDLGEIYPASRSGYMLPSDLDGPLPPKGAPNFFVRFDDDAWGYSQDQLEIWEFHADWPYPDNSAFVSTALLATDPFNSDLCGYDVNCIPQPDTEQGVDALSSRLMYRLQYRNFGDHQSMVVNHTVNVETDNANHAGIRWYELRNNGKDWNIHQQGTYAPDKDHRWMGSIAMDRNGNIALGYSVSGTSTYPSIRYTGRLAKDPPGLMVRGEAVLTEGKGSQRGFHHRWGDYSMMSVDPSDDCTFWYTQEYYERTSDSGWQTRIGSFRFPSCTTGPSGSLAGNVTDDQGQPIANAKIKAGDSLTITDKDGFFQFSHLPVGDYDISVSSYGFVSQAMPVTIKKDQELILNFSLIPSQSHEISGQVTDANTGWPLYARIVISAELFSETLFTDPVTGDYAYNLFADTQYELEAEAVTDGYKKATREFKYKPGNSELNFTLSADETCRAPGYGILNETFDACTLPDGWHVSKSPISGSQFSVSGSQSNFTGGERCFAVSDSNSAGYADVDTELISPGFDCSDLKKVTLEFKYDFRTLSGSDIADADVSNDGGATWVNVWTRKGGSEQGPATARVNISSQARAQPDVRIRFHHYNAFYEYWWQVDDVKVYEPKMPCQGPGSGGLVLGNVYNANTGEPVNGAVIVSDDTLSAVSMPTPDDPALDDGFYVLYARPGTHKLTAAKESHGPDTKIAEVRDFKATKQDFFMRAPGLVSEPPALEARVNFRDQHITPITLNNKGDVYAGFEISIISEQDMDNQSYGQGVTENSPLKGGQGGVFRGHGLSEYELHQEGNSQVPGDSPTHKRAQSDNEPDNPADWLHVNPESGAVRSGDSKEIDVFFDTRASSVNEIGEYKAFMMINDRNSQNLLTIPVIMHVINAPAAADDNVLATQDKPVVIEVLANDTLPEQDNIVVKAMSDPLHGTVSTDGITIEYTPDKGFAGRDSFAYTISNDEGDESEASVFVGVWKKLTNTCVENLDIPDGDPAGLVSDLGITSKGVTESINVTLNITHPCMEDLRVCLISPLGTEIALFENIPGSGKNLAQMNLSDEAPFSITDKDASYTKSLRPAEAFETFKGEPAQGEWRLEIYDDSDLDRGTLVSWQLDIYYMYDSVIRVDTTEDALSDNGNCSLREAVLAASTDQQADNCPGGGIRDTIILPDGIYTLALEGDEEDENKTGDIDIRGPGYISITGQTESGTVIETSANDRLFHVHEGADVEIRNLTIRGGVPEPFSVSVEGGGLLNEGKVLVKNCTLTENNSSYRGGGFYNPTGEAVLDSVTITKNNARFGGGVNNRYGKLTLTDSIVMDNRAVAKGGGVYNYLGETLLDFSTITSNSADQGGALFAYGGEVRVNSVTMDNNKAFEKGGGVYKSGGKIRFDSATISNNNAEYGGGIYNISGEMTMLNSTVSGNSAEYNAGVYNNGNAVLDFSTITNNEAVKQGGGFSNSGSVRLQRTVIAKNSAFSDGTTADIRGNVTSLGTNLIGNSAGTKGYHETDLLDTDPLLAPLADNGGTVMTHAIRVKSPGINAADCEASEVWEGEEGSPVKNDQRGKERPWGICCDIGAFEYDGRDYPPIAADDNVSTWGKPVDIDVLANDTDTNGEALTVTWAGDPSNGTTVINTDTVTYAPDPGFTGQDSFDYTITDGHNSDKAKVTVTVHSNTPPSARDDIAVTYEGEPVTAEVLSNDSDRDGDKLSVTGMTVPFEGVITLDKNVITYTPNKDFVGQDSFDYSVTDGTDTASATVIVTVLAEHVSIGVTTLDDELNEDGDCSLREAVQAATANQPADRCPGGGFRDLIILPEGVFSLTEANPGLPFATGNEQQEKDRSSGDLDITAGIVIIQGSDSEPTVLDGNGLDRVLHIYEGADAELHNVTVRRGGGEGINGGAILNQGNLKLNSCTLAENSADKGGAIFNKGVMTLLNTTVSGNSAAKGGGIYNESEIRMNFTTISQNRATGEGGGVYSAEKSTTQLKNTLISGNSADMQGPDLFGTVKSQGANLIGTSSGGTGYSKSDFPDTDPLILPLADNGGPSMTHAVQADGPCADAGICQGSSGALESSEETDQRGVSRPWGSSCDIGAFEYDGEYYLPVAADDSAHTKEESPVTIRVLENDRDANGVFFISGISQAENGDVRENFEGTVTYAPNKGFIGDDFFHYTISDRTATDTARVTVSVVENRPPMPLDDIISTTRDKSVVIEVLKNDTDPDDYEISVTQVADPDNGTAVTDGATVTYTPDQGFVGTDRFMYRVSDGAKSDKGLIIVTVYSIDMADAIWILKVLAGIKDGTAYNGPYAGTDGKAGFEEVIYILQTVSGQR